MWILATSAAPWMTPAQTATTPCAPGLEATAAAKALVEIGGEVAERAAVPLLGEQYEQSVRIAAAEQAAAVDSAGSGTSGRTAVPGALAFTGLPAAALAGLGLLVLALGALAVVAGRRRTTQG